MDDAVDTKCAYSFQLACQSFYRLTPRTFIPDLTKIFSQTAGLVDAFQQDLPSPYFTFKQAFLKFRLHIFIRLLLTSSSPPTFYYLPCHVEYDFVTCNNNNNYNNTVYHFIIALKKKLQSKPKTSQQIVTDGSTIPVHFSLCVDARSTWQATEVCGSTAE
ncbi:hypothetical protein HELRODRAFT_169262 [Helobdella robusta]|uniref:Uncharacterized protein n=1 Tax=Helobdella robusta TaxID=6412 RepID=T1F1N4_HELRO|nr:hypothetical protein HELRODRAFT_169262 [Helobdella robusta]ESO08420.1 hypothetical protein HELRODRAFT_169262 [Helobdella robusta]